MAFWQQTSRLHCKRTKIESHWQLYSGLTTTATAVDTSYTLATDSQTESLGDDWHKILWDRYSSCHPINSVKKNNKYNRWTALRLYKTRLQWLLRNIITAVKLHHHKFAVYWVKYSTKQHQTWFLWAGATSWNKRLLVTAEIHFFQLLANHLWALAKPHTCTLVSNQLQTSKSKKITDWLDLIILKHQVLD